MDITIPQPFLVTVDDVGWWNGWNGSAQNQPFRTGMGRRHVPGDYQALADFGRRLSMRIPAGLVLCEWDQTGLLKQLPSATWMGSRWQAPPGDRAQREAAASILNRSRPFIEPALHGIGHEFWINGRMDRSEFHTAEGRMRHPDEIKQHLEYFFLLLQQNHLDTDVNIFIPPALNHSFGNGKSGFQNLASAFGIQYISLVFDRTRCHAPPQFKDVGWENRVVLMDRGPSPIDWHRTAASPLVHPDQPILPLHWANILHGDPERNIQVVDRWVSLIDRHLKTDRRIAAKDLRQCLTQHLHHTRSRIHPQGSRIIVHMDWIHKIPVTALADSVFFSLPPCPQIKIRVSGAHKILPATEREKPFLKLSLPPSGKIIFQLQPSSH